MVEAERRCARYLSAMEGSGVRAMEAQPAAPLGMAWTRALFATWAERPLPTLVPWALGSLCIGLMLLGAAVVVATLAGPGEPYTPIFADPTASAADVGGIVMRNTTVLALQVLVCAGSYVTTRPGHHAGWGVGALYVVAGLSISSIASQAWRLGHDLSTAGNPLGFTSA